MDGGFAVTGDAAVGVDFDEDGGASGFGGEVGGDVGDFHGLTGRVKNATETHGNTQKVGKGIED